jgi:hypothetical protein
MQNKLFGKNCNVIYTQFKMFLGGSMAKQKRTYLSNLTTQLKNYHVHFILELSLKCYFRMAKLSFAI